MGVKVIWERKVEVGLGEVIVWKINEEGTTWVEWQAKRRPTRLNLGFDPSSNFRSEKDTAFSQLKFLFSETTEDRDTFREEIWLTKAFICIRSIVVCPEANRVERANSGPSSHITDSTSPAST